MGKSRALVYDQDNFNKFIRRDRAVILQLIPDRGLRNYAVESLAKVMAELHSPIKDRISLRDPHFRTLDLFSFRIVLSKENIGFYLIVPERLADHFKQKILAVWEKATIKPIGSLPSLDPSLCSCCELTYRRHDIFSLNTDRDTNDPLTSLLAASSEMDPKDQAVVDILFDPASRVQWEYDAQKAYEKFQRGGMPRRFNVDLGNLFRGGFSYVNNGINAALKEISDAMGDTADRSQDRFVYGLDPERQAMIVNGLSAATTSKLNSATLKAWIRIASQSKSADRARLSMRAMAGAFKDINGDNELIRKNVSARSIVRQIEEVKRPLTGGIFLSTAEAGKLMQLPTAGLQDLYPIEAINKREVNVSEELFADPLGIPIGNVTEKGITRKAFVPVNAYSGTSLKEVYDALCTATMVTGQMGCGKTEGVGINWTHGFLMNGLSVFMIDTADGELARKVEDSLPEDFPDDHIIHIDLDNKHFPIALNWGDVASRKMISAEGDDLEALEMAERLTGRLVDYVDGSAHAELSERMRQYLTSAARAVLIDPNKSLLDVELALRSPSYREELLADPRILSQIEVMQDLESLQNKAASGSDAAIIDPIISRLKMFMETRSLSNLFLQPNKIGSDGKPILDFRKLMDGDGGKYGYLITIHASQDAWSEDGQELILSYLQDKILMAAYSRVDIPQDQRKPCLNLVDEPHRFINKAARLYKSASVELRKYRLKLLWLAHYMSQMGAAAQAVASGGCQFTQYKTQDLKQFSELTHVFQPFESDELYKALPEKWEAVNKVRLPSGKECPAFIAKMEAPPKVLRSRDDRRKQCAEFYGRGWQDVSKYIQELRIKYQRLDEEWRSARKENKKG